MYQVSLHLRSFGVHTILILFRQPCTSRLIDPELGNTKGISSMEISVWTGGDASVKYDTHY
jgi:hypothetical protein